MPTTSDIGEWPQGFQESDRWFDVALHVAREFTKMHIISSDSDCIAVVFYGTVRERLLCLCCCACHRAACTDGTYA